MNVVFFMGLLSLAFVAGPVAEVEMLYYQGSYEEVIEKAEGCLAADSMLDMPTSVELRKYMAFSYVALGRTDDAKAEFRTILSLDSTLVLDPELVSPKIILVFDEVRKELESLGNRLDSFVTVGANTGPTSTLSLRTATLRSFAFPGLGQLYAKETTKGWLFAVGEGLCLCGGVVLQVFTIKAHREYLEATDPLEIEARYRVYNNWFRARNAFAGLTVGIWVSAPLEILIFPPVWARGR